MTQKMLNECGNCSLRKGCTGFVIGKTGCSQFCCEANVEEVQETKRDPQSRHYDAGGLEVQDIIRAKLTPEQYEGFCLGNIIKYSCRANFKGSFDRDIEKAGFYSSFLMETKG